MPDGCTGLITRDRERIGHFVSQMRARREDGATGEQGGRRMRGLAATSTLLYRLLPIPVCWQGGAPVRNPYAL